MTKFEDLPNEVIYELFDYLDLSDCFQAFFYQNNRFKYLLKTNALFFKINLSYLSKSIFEECCKKIISKNVSRIISLRFTNPLTIDFFHTLIPLNQLFIHLQSIVFNEINFEKLEPILISLSLLPRLYSLAIHNNIEISDSSSIYELIFQLPVLKSCIILPKFYGGSLLLKPMTNGKSSIEYLSINRHCSLNQFLTFLSYTPNLRRLSNFTLSETTPIHENQFPEIYPKLTNVSMKLWRMSFESLKYLSKKLFFHIEILKICTRADDYYLLAERWEDLIINSMPNLRLFDFQHYWEPVDNDENEQRTYHSLIDRFNSSFWTDRQWYFTHQHFPRRGIRDSVFYSTNPYRYKTKTKSIGLFHSSDFFFLDDFRRNLYELHERAHNDDCPRRDRGENFARRVNIDDYRATRNCSIYFPYAKDVSLWGKSARGNYSFISDLHQMFDFSKLKSFSIQCPDFGFIQLIELLNYLPNLHSLILYSNTSYLSTKDIPLFENHNRIMNVNVRGRCRIEQIDLLMKICPYMKCLQIEIDDDQLEIILRSLLLGKLVDQIDFDTSKTKFDGWSKKLFEIFSRTSSSSSSSSKRRSLSMNETNFTLSTKLFLLCFFNPQPGMDLKLQRILSREKFLQNYSIDSVLNYLYLWW